MKIEESSIYIFRYFSHYDGIFSKFTKYSALVSDSLKMEHSPISLGIVTMSIVRKKINVGVNSFESRLKRRKICCTH